MRVIVIHGTKGGPEENWFPWLGERVTEEGHQFILPQYPLDTEQTLTNWWRIFKDTVGPVTTEDILVGHSVGAVMMMRILETLDAPVRASFFVSGFTGLLGLPDIDPVIGTFVEKSFDWTTIKANAGEAHVYHGDYDPAVPMDQALL